jgi:hypothetical protein
MTFSTSSSLRSLPRSDQTIAVHRTPTMASALLLAFFEHGSEAFEVLDDAGLLGMKARSGSLRRGTSRASVDVADLQHLAPQNHLRASQSDDATRIFPPSTFASAKVVLSLVPKFLSE